MDTYLMMLYVSLEQETALKQFFLQNGWQYCRPDLAVVTDNIGPHVEQVPHFVEKFTEADYMPSKPQRVRKANKRKAQEASVEVEPETEQASDGSDTHSDIDNGEAVHSDIEDTECIPEIKVELVSDVADDNEYVDHVNSDPDYEPGDDGLHDIVKEKRKTKGLNTESSVNVQNTDGTVLDDSGSDTDIPKPTPAKRKKKGRKSAVSTVADEANTSKTKMKLKKPTLLEEPMLSKEQSTKAIDHSYVIWIEDTTPFVETKSSGSKSKAVFGSKDVPLSATEVDDILKACEAGQHSEKIITVLPTTIAGGDIYVIDLETLVNPKDVKVDRFVWLNGGKKKLPNKNSKMFKHFYKIRLPDNKYSKLFQKNIYERIENRRYAVVHYYGNPDIFEPMAHGNSKRKLSGVQENLPMSDLE